MLETKQNQRNVTGIVETRWQELYRIGFIASVAFPLMILIAVIAYFIYPYTPGTTDVANIFTDLQNNRLAGLVKLDLTVPIILPILILQFLALYIALKRVNESYALIALVLGLMSVVLWFTARPLVEMTNLSDKYAAATSDTAKSQYLAAGEAFNALFNGTNWMLSQFLIGISYLISILLMFRGKIFSKVTAYVGLANTLAGFCFLIPVIGSIALMLSTIGGAVWNILLARDFYRLGWGKSKASQVV
ncbi:MAG: DUF4386 family protein [Chloroflexi bacterium]|uniref:DUF4386 family protein n=1 Tax=Candidatus Chlorohelix allophototropha TaxID=3003348 RepID=A0A8T7M9X7_9CHLR|nr:DUF4386 family protein [Chloroflexota bacterium]WJW68783.1 DUF4386 family protein [Chloroflexota bacterium L227-S17]